MGVGDDFRHILPTSNFYFLINYITNKNTYIIMSTSLDALKAYAYLDQCDMEQ
jgi:hypothetical protein